VVYTSLLPPGTPSGSYVVDVIYLGFYDNGREFETDPFPVAVTVDAAGGGFACTGTKVIVCGTSQQSLSTCGTP
jgi:hypothetical protein